MSDYYRIIRNGWGRNNSHYEIVRLSKIRTGNYVKILSVTRVDSLNLAVREVQKRTVFSTDYYVDYQDGHHFHELNIKDEAELVEFILSNG